ncbi:bifunctional DNA primase/polymerase-like protein [Haloactinopolyspora alba]|uniref:Bifunctional DNA primase/polymerase-like protein n=1 Tax=Haloactinopolyspora alba TaxID=648780 RepID=A0A2P8EFC6_9ACTN|nr:bifunctional DNA primase/polymerase [Haloactinopolyspora alba]PSL08150.1 bifunctional DNA primase/polymerase-like protein [Haloactinopolyspora alba]
MVMVDEALSFAAAGIAVFPCAAGGKQPLTEHGYTAATTDPGQIQDWWRRWPDANLAMPTGAPLWDVLDIDMKNGESGYPALRELARAGLTDGWSHAVRTPSGGLHLYYAGTAEGNHALHRHKIDYRGAGGYVLLPPSLVTTDHGTQRYDTIDVRDPGQVQPFDWTTARDLLQPPAPTPPPDVGTAGGGHAPAEPRMTHLVNHVRNTQPGNRNNALYWAANRALDNGSTDLTPLVAAAIEAGLEHHAAHRTVASAQRQRASHPQHHSGGPAGRRASMQAAQQHAAPGLSI